MWTIPNCKIPDTGHFMKISPLTTRATWAEVRTTKDMKKKECRKGEECTYQVCAFSNHSATDQKDKKEGGREDR